MMNPSIAGFWGGNIDCYLKNMGLYCFRMVVWKIWRNEDLKYGDSAHIAGSTSRIEWVVIVVSFEKYGIVQTTMVTLDTASNNGYV